MCLDKAVLAQGGGGVPSAFSKSEARSRLWQDSNQHTPEYHPQNHRKPLIFVDNQKTELPNSNLQKQHLVLFWQGRGSHRGVGGMTAIATCNLAWHPMPQPREPHFQGGPRAVSRVLTSIHLALVEEHKETALWPNGHAPEPRK